MMPLRGHTAQERALLDAMASGRMHHGWLLAGAPGIGKASFALAAATRLLSGEGGATRLQLPADHPTARLVEARSHPDFRLLQRDLDDGDTVRRNIPVDDVRGLQPLLTGTAALGERRVVVIDAVDDLERGAANALLKSLEEPPAGVVFLLVSHAPGRLLPTIRSRVRTLRFDRLGDDDMCAAMADLRGELAEEEREALIRLGDGSPGRALALAGLDLAAVDAMLQRIVEGGDADRALRLDLVRALGARSAQARYRAFLERVPAFIAAAATRRRGLGLAQALAAWDEANGLAASAVPLSLDPPGVILRMTGIVAGLAGRDVAAKG